MKKTTTWATLLRRALARNSGRISSIDAPVVPIKLPRQAPNPRNMVLSSGEPCKAPRT